MDDNKKFWDKTARFYGFSQRSSINGYKKIIEYLEPYLKRDSEVLELACGTGQVTFLLADKVDKLIATDFSKEMIKMCMKNNEKGVNFSVEDATNLSFSDNKFDLIVAANLLHIVPEPDKILSEMKRVLKPGGIICVPIFVDDYRKFNLRLWLLERIGFVVYGKNNKEGYLNYLKSQDVEILFAKSYLDKALDELIVIAKFK